MAPPNETRSGGWFSPYIYLSNNWISLTGVVIVTSAVVFWLFLLPTSLRGEVTHPYIGILAFLMLPGFFFLGLALIPIGMWLHVRTSRRRGEYPQNFPPLDVRNRELRKLLLFVGVTTFANIIISSQVTYRAITYMDSATFCGQTCHKVMQPEFTAYQNSPHSRVECVSCHIGPGASWFVRSKLSGTGQVIAVALNNYPRPVPTPVHNLRPARETCEACHWPQRFEEDRLRIVPHYADDEKNTFTQTVLLMRLGGGRVKRGIHGVHLGQGVVIEYTSDESRQTIPQVTYRNELTGQTTVYNATDTKVSSLKNPATRVMDCIDCHNRPTHTFELADPGVNRAMANGAISPELPFAHKQSVAIIQKSYSTREEAATAIPAAFETFYQEKYPDIYRQRTADVKRSAQGALAVYNRNVFPHMRVTWGTYPNNLGHMDFPGCFRCHDGSHTSSGGKTVNNDCNTCHQLLAMDEPNPKVLSDLGISNGQASAAADGTAGVSQEPAKGDVKK